MDYRKKTSTEHNKTAKDLRAIFIVFFIHNSIALYCVFQIFQVSTYRFWN